MVVGGLSESMITQPGKYYLKLKDRKGFIRMALHEGYTFSRFRYFLVSTIRVILSTDNKFKNSRADLVPMFHFGENETYIPAKGICPKRLRNMQVLLSTTN